MRISDWSSDVCSSDLVGCRASLAKSRTLTRRFAPPSPAAQERGFGSRGPRTLSCEAGEGLSPWLLGQLVPEERVVQRPHVRRLLVGGAGAVAAFGVFVVAHENGRAAVRGRGGQ